MNSLRTKGDVELNRGDYGKNRKTWIATTTIGDRWYKVKVFCVSARSALIQGSRELEAMLKDEQKLKLPNDLTVRVVCEDNPDYASLDW